MDETQQRRLLESAPPEARAGYEKLARAGLLTPEMLLAMAALAESLDKFRPQPSGEAPRDFMREVAQDVADRHGITVEQALEDLKLY